MRAGIRFLDTPIEQKPVLRHSGLSESIKSREFLGNTEYLAKTLAEAAPPKEKTTYENIKHATRARTKEVVPAGAGGDFVPLYQRAESPFPMSLAFCECGEETGSVHSCPSCRRNMHAFCGTGIGEEGYGQPRLCKRCQN